MLACGLSTTFIKALYINAASAFLRTPRLTPGASPYIGRALSFFVTQRKRNIRCRSAPEVAGYFQTTR